MKNLVKILVTILVTIFVANESANAQVELKIKKKSQYEIVVSGDVPANYKSTEILSYEGGKVNRQVGPGLFLGVTLILDGEEFDFSVDRVDGKFKKTYSENAISLAHKGIDILFENHEVIWVAALWKGKMNRGACSYRNGGSSCKYCRKNGFHLDNQVAKEVAR